MAKKEKLYYDDAGSTFKEAFAEARAGGKKTFEWNGEKYNTKLKSDDKGPDQSAAETKRLAQQADATKEEPRKPTNRGAAAALASAGIGMGTAALLSGMRRAEETRKEREVGKASGKDVTRSPIRNIAPEEAATENMKRGGKVKKYAVGGSVGSASKRADGIAQRGKTRGKIC